MYPKNIIPRRVSKASANIPDDYAKTANFHQIPTSCTFLFIWRDLAQPTANSETQPTAKRPQAAGTRPRKQRHYWWQPFPQIKKK